MEENRFMHFLAILAISLGTGKCANILGVLISPSLSHHMVFQPIWRELSLRGHQVTVVTPDPLNDPTLTNLTEISVRFLYNVMNENIFKTMVSGKLNKLSAAESIHKVLHLIGERVLNSSQFQELITDQSKKFDLILIEFVFPVMHALSERFKAPLIMVSYSDIYNFHYDLMGNPNHPVLYPEIVLNLSLEKPTLWQKLLSVSFFSLSKFYFQSVFVPQSHKLAEKYFGNVSYTGDLARNSSMLFINTNRLIHHQRPKMPGIVEIGPRHIEPPKALPEDLQNILDDAKEGAIYFSLGSNVKSMLLEEQVLNDIFQALAEIPFKVLLKWDLDDLPEKPSNVIIRKWFPQKDVLAHPNIKAFVTQGGLQSVEEAISREVPLIGIPFFADQPINVRRIVELGIGEGIDLRNLSRNKLKNTIMKVAQTRSYKDRIKEARIVLFDRPINGLESAVWWSEYVIRHKGAKHVKSPLLDTSWFEYLLVDVLLVYIVGSLILSYVLHQFVTKILNSCTPIIQKR